MADGLILLLIAITLLVVFVIIPFLVCIPILVRMKESVEVKHSHSPRESEIATYKKPEYRITSEGNLWFGPTNPESTMHWAYLDGVDSEGKSVWVLSRTEEPPHSLPATNAEAEFIMRIAQDVRRR